MVYPSKTSTSKELNFGISRGIDIVHRHTMLQKKVTFQDTTDGSYHSLSDGYGMAMHLILAHKAVLVRKNGKLQLQEFVKLYQMDQTVEEVDNNTVFSRKETSTTGDKLKYQVDAAGATVTGSFWKEVGVKDEEKLEEIFAFRCTAAPSLQTLARCMPMGLRISSFSLKVVCVHSEPSGDPLTTHASQALGLE
eukprot:Gb_34940 [translate_table: standard]